MTKTSPQARTGASRGIPNENQDNLDQDDWIVPIEGIEENDINFLLTEENLLLTEDDLDDIIAIARYDEAPLGDFNFLTRDGCYRNGKPLYSAH